MSVIHGLLERISFHNEENDFVVAKLREKNKRELCNISSGENEQIPEEIEI
jgi:hypothetical protein